jgi:hypothetical protein
VQHLTENALGARAMGLLFEEKDRYWRGWTASHQMYLTARGSDALPVNRRPLVLSRSDHMM